MFLRFDLIIDLIIYNVGCMHWNYEPVTLDEVLHSAQIPTEEVKDGEE